MRCRILFVVLLAAGLSTRGYSENETLSEPTWLEVQTFTDASGVCAVSFTVLASEPERQCMQDYLVLCNLDLWKDKPPYGYYQSKTPLRSELFEVKNWDPKSGLPLLPPVGERN